MSAAPTKHEFCIKLSMASIEGRPLSVTLARYDDPNKNLIGVSPGFLALCGCPREDVIGKNCRFLNQGMDMKLREQLRHAVRTGKPFMGVLENQRHVGGGQATMFENLLHLTVISIGASKYIIGVQANVTGLNLELADGGRDAARVQKVFDSVLSAGVDTWIHIQEGSYHSLPLYIYIRDKDTAAAEGKDPVEIVEGALRGGDELPSLLSPDHHLALEPRLTLVQGEGDGPLKLEKKWEMLGEPLEVPEQAAGAAESLGFYARKAASGGSAGYAKANGAAQNDTPVVLALDEALKAPPPKVVTLTDVDFDWDRCCERQISQPSRQVSQMSRQISLQSNDSDTHTLKTQLEAFNGKKAECILIARGITKLGDRAAELLRAHFSSFGVVEDVRIPYVGKKLRGAARWESDELAPREKRASGRCFIVMSAVEDAKRILQQGPAHVVDGISVTLELFSFKDGQDGDKSKGGATVQQ